MSKGARLRAERKDSMSDNPSPEEVAAMLNRLTKAPQQEQREPSALEVSCGGRLLLVQTPATVVLKDENKQPGESFYVTDLQAWGWTPFGVLAVGSFNENATEDDWESRLFAADTVHNIIFNKERYEEIIEEIKAEEEAEVESDSDEGDTGGDSTEAADPLAGDLAAAA